jgi:hypothetical protein
MMQELSFRSRGGKKLQATLKQKKRGDCRINNVPGEETVDVAAAAEPCNFPVAGDSAKGPKEDSDEVMQDDIALDDDWVDSLVLESDPEIGDPPKNHPAMPPRVEIVIEDSDDDETV